MREAWTDERLDDLNRNVDARFDRLEAKVDEGFAKVDARFERVEDRFERVEDKFDSLHRVLMFSQTSFVVALIGLFAAQL